MHINLTHPRGHWLLGHGPALAERPLETLTELGRLGDVVRLRLGPFTAFLLNGHLIECCPTPQLFTTPGDPRTEAYITGRFG